MKDTTAITQERIDRAMQLRLSPFPQMTMELLSRQLNQMRIGDLRPAARTFEIMLERDPDLLGVAGKRFAGPAELSWEVYKTEDSAEAERHADALRYFYENLTTTHVLDQDETGDFSMLVEQMMTAWAHRYAAHEMILRIDSAGKKQVTAQFQQCPVWFFESRHAKLRFLKDEGAYEGLPMAEGEWLVTVGPGFMRPCAIMYLTKWEPMANWMFYSSRFSLPGIHGETPAQKGTKEWEDQLEALQNFANGWITLSQVGTKINLIETKSGGQNLPMPLLIENANACYAKLWRGGDLSTQSKGDGVGANLQVEEKDVLLGWDCRKLNGTLNARIDRFLIRFLFNAEPKAYVAITLPKAPETDNDIKAADFLVAHGARIAIKTMHERLGIPEAEPEEKDLLTKPAAPALIPNAPLSPEQQLANEAALDTSSRDLLAEVTAHTLQGLLKRLDDANAITNPDLRRISLAAVLQEIEQLKQELQHDNPVAAALMQIQTAGFVNGIENTPK